MDDIKPSFVICFQVKTTKIENNAAKHGIVLFNFICNLANVCVKFINEVVLFQLDWAYFVSETTFKMKII